MSNNFYQCPDCGEWLHKNMDMCTACGAVIPDEDENNDEEEL